VSTAEIIAEKDALLLKKDQQIEQLQFQYKQVLKLLYGSKTERFISNTEDASQLHLFNQDEQGQSEEKQTEQISYERKRPSKKHPGRHPIPDHLPVVEQTIEPQGGTEGLVKIGEEVTQTLDYTPASLIKRITIRPKYINKETETIHIAASPDRFMEKGIAEPGLLAHLVVNKYVDHLPLYRQAKQFARDFNWQVSTNTLNNWMRYICDRFEPVYESLHQQVLTSTYIQVDESPLKVLERKEQKSKGKSPPSQKKRMIGYQWVYMSPEHKSVYFEYRKGRGMHGPKETLADYVGYVQCDGYKVYDKLARQESGIRLIGCLAHARRKFYEAKDSDPKRSKYAMVIFKRIYHLDSQYAREDLSVNNQRLEMRHTKMKAEYENLLNWIKEESTHVLPKSPIGKAMNYFQAQYSKLIGCLDRGDLHIDNNWVENKIRPLALGRKNYLFAGSHNGARWIAMMYSFFGTCYMHNVNPREWLIKAMEQMTHTKIEDYADLLPGKLVV